MPDPTFYERRWRDMLNQRQVATGRAPMPEELAAYRSGELEEMYRGEQINRGLAIQQQQANTAAQAVGQQGMYQQGQLALQRRQMGAAQSGAMMQAISSPVSTAGTLYGLYKGGQAIGLIPKAGTAAATALGTGAGTFQGSAAEAFAAGLGEEIGPVAGIAGGGAAGSALAASSAEAFAAGLGEEIGMTAGTPFGPAGIAAGAAAGYLATQVDWANALQSFANMISGIGSGAGDIFGGLGGLASAAGNFFSNTFGGVGRALGL